MINMKNIKVKEKNLYFTLVFILVFVSAYFLSRYNYLLFHVLAENFAVITCVLIFVLAEKTFKYSNNNYLLFLGNAYLFVAIIDLFHTITYRGMGVFTSFTANTPTQLWIAARLLETISLAAALCFIKKGFPRILVRCIYAVVTLLILYATLVNDLFPSCFIEGQGLTPFKVGSEYFICAVLLLVLFYLYKNKQNINATIFKTISLSVIITILSELSFTLYSDVYGVMNFIGHILKIISFIIIFQGIIYTGLESPYDIIFDKLQTLSYTDPLTKLFNRRYFISVMEKEIERIHRGGNNFSVIMLDLDRFKNINDMYGHNKGDIILKEIANTINSRMRKIDIAARWGGEEFVIMLINTSLDQAANVAEELRCQISNLNILDVGKITASFGVVSYCEENGLDDLIKEVDNAMYEAKAAGRNCVILHECNKPHQRMDPIAYFGTIHS